MRPRVTLQETGSCTNLMDPRRESDREAEFKGITYEVRATEKMELTVDERYLLRDRGFANTPVCE